MSYRTSRRDLIKHGLVIAAAGGVAPVLGSSAGSSLSFEEYRSYDALGLAQLVRNKDVSAMELLELLGGIPAGVRELIYAAPIAVNEMVLALWLIIKGFKRDALAAPEEEEGLAAAQPAV